MLFHRQNYLALNLQQADLLCTPIPLFWYSSKYFPSCVQMDNSLFYPQGIFKLEKGCSNPKREVYAVHSSKP